MLATMIMLVALGQCGPSGCSIPQQSFSGGNSFLQALPQEAYKSAARPIIQHMPESTGYAPFRIQHMPESSARYVAFDDPPTSAPPPTPAPHPEYTPPTMRYLAVRPQPTGPPPSSPPPTESVPYAVIEDNPLAGWDFVSHEQDVDWGWYFINFDGMIFPVWGYHVDRRTVRWSPSLRANAAVLTHARLTR